MGPPPWDERSQLPPSHLPPLPHPSSPRTDLTLLTPHTRHLQFVADMALAFTETVTPDEALSFALERICHFAGWHYGEVWLPRIADNGTITLICSPLWHSHDSAYWQDFRDLSLASTFEPGEGLPGRVWQRQEAEWIPNLKLNTYDFFRRAPLAQTLGLQAGLGVPIIGHGEVLAVLVFFRLDQHPEDQALVNLVSTLAIHLGSVVQRKRMEVAIQASEARLQALFTSLPGFVFRKQGQAPWTMQYLSSGCRELLGYSPEHLMGVKKHPCYQDLIHPKDWRQVQGQMQEAIQHRSCYVVEYRVKTREGKERWLWEKGCGRYSRQGKLLSLEGFITDISDRKAVELKFQNQQAFLGLVLDTIPHAIFWKDRDLHYLGGNRRWLQEFGLSQVESIIGKTDLDLHPPDLAEHYRRNDLEVLDNQIPRLHRVQSYTSPQGQVTYKDSSKVPIYNAEHELVGILGTYEDITERRKAELQLAQRERYMAAIVSIQTLLLAPDQYAIPHDPILQHLGEVSGADRLYWVEASPKSQTTSMGEPGFWISSDGTHPVFFHTPFQAQWLRATHANPVPPGDPTRSVAADSMVLPSPPSVSAPAPPLSPGSPSAPPQAGPPAPHRSHPWPLDWNKLQPQLCYVVQGQVIHCQATDLRGLGRSYLERQGVKSMLILPLIAQHQFFGFLCFENHRSDRLWSEAEVQMLQSATLSIALMQEHYYTLRELAQAERQYRSIFENAVEGIFQSTPQGNYQTVNPMLARIYGYESPEALVSEVQDVGAQLYVDPADRQRFVDLMQRDGLVRGFEAQVRRKDGQVIWVTEYARAVYGPGGEIVSYEGTVQDITERKQTEAILQNRDRLLQGLATANHCLLSNPDITIAIPLVLEILGKATDADRVYLYQNHPHDPSGALAMSMRYEWCAPDIAPSINQPHWQNLPYSAYGLTRWYQNFSQGYGIYGWVKDFPPEEQALLGLDDIQRIIMMPVLVDEQLWGYVGFDDCRGNKSWAMGELAILKTMAASLGSAFKRQETEQVMEYQAFHDDLTGLPNRIYVNQSLPLALESAAAHNESLAVMFLDLDRFKTINDSLGHAVGDRLLQQATARLLSVLRKTDTIARWGGDEFTLYLPRLKSHDEVSELCRRLLEVLRPPILIDNHQLHVSASIGVAIYPQDGTNAATLLSHADMAMYRVKEQGRNHFQFYQGTTSDQASRELILEQDLYHALPRQEFYLCYQPRVDASTGEILQMEVLLRWRHPGFGLVSPAVFIKIAEDNGLMVPIGEWVLRSACSQARQWCQQGFPIRVAVNLSPRQFRDKNLVHTIRQVLTETQLDPHYLELEITETVAMTDVEFSIQVLQELHQMGVRLALDDFGTGYSALNRLKRFPLDTLKIDQSFVRGLPDDAQDLAIVSTIMALGQGFGLQAVAEGVETREQLACLRNLGCAEVQGFLFSPGLRTTEALALLQQNQGHLDVSAASDWIKTPGDRTPEAGH